MAADSIFELGTMIGEALVGSFEFSMVLSYGGGGWKTAERPAVSRERQL